MISGNVIDIYQQTAEETDRTNTLLSENPDSVQIHAISELPEFLALDSDPVMSDTSSIGQQTHNYYLDVSITETSYVFGSKYESTMARIFNSNNSVNRLRFKNERELLEGLYSITKAGQSLRLEITLPERQELSDLPNYVGSILLGFMYRPRPHTRLFDNTVGRLDLLDLFNQFIGNLVSPFNQALIVKIKTPEGLLSPSQQAQMNRLVNVNKANILAWARHLVISSVSTVIGACIAASMTGGVLLAGFLTGSFLAKFREVFLDSISKDYNSPIKISEVTNDEEKQALLNGLEAKTWTGYFSSWGSLTNYKNLGAFCAAEKFACEGNKDIVNEIKKFRAMG